MADTVQASHILVMYAGSQGSSASRSKEEALERIQMVAAEMVNNDVDFADLAGGILRMPVRTRWRGSWRVWARRHGTGIRRSGF